MNIFKILSSGDQKLKEPAVTSFLAFLLDPNESHGLKTILLEYFLKPIIENPENAETYKDFYIKTKDGSHRMKSNLIYDFTFNIDTEVSTYFKKNSVIEEEISDKYKKSRNDIDIVITISKYDSDGKLLNKHAFLIENKLNDGAIGKNDNQLISQRNSFTDEYNSFDNVEFTSIGTIFLTPDTSTSEKYFKEFKESIEKNMNVNIPFYHHFWRTNEKNGIYFFLNDILSKESVGLIEPLQDYTKHTIKAFMNFIETGFKSKKDEKDESESHKKKYFESYLELKHIWKLKEENGELIEHIINKSGILQNDIKYTNRHISFKNSENRNYVAIKRPPTTINHLPCVIKPNPNYNYPITYKLTSDGKWYSINITRENVGEFIDFIILSNNNK